MNLPNFLVIGAAKSGTTSLNSYLKQHPEIYMCPVKGPNFFAFDGLRPDFSGPDNDHVRTTSVYELEEYQALFSGVTTERAVGEVSPRYLFSTKAPVSINRHIPHARLIAVLRNPVDRAYSAYTHRVRDGWETSSFAEALRQETPRAKDNWAWGHYAYASRYYERLKPYFDRFPRDQIRVYIFEEFRREAVETMQDMFRFLRIEPTFVPAISAQLNASGVIRNPLIRMIWHKSRKLRGWIRPFCPASLRYVAAQRVTRNLVKQALQPELRKELLHRFKPDIESLEKLLERDLSIWLKLPPPPAELSR